MIYCPSCLRKPLSVLVPAGLHWISNHTYGSVYYSFSTVRGCGRVFFLFSVIWRVFLTFQWETHASLQTQAWNHIYKVVTPSNTSFFTRNSVASCWLPCFNLKHEAYKKSYYDLLIPLACIVHVIWWATSLSPTLLLWLEALEAPWLLQRSSNPLESPALSWTFQSQSR